LFPDQSPQVVCINTSTIIVYKTTNTVNCHFYIGVHKVPEGKKDRYLGSGVGLKRALALYGKDKFVRETLFTTENVEEAYAKEVELLKGVYNTDECYNMHPGGRGIRGSICRHSPEWRAKVSKANRRRRGFHHSEETCQLIGEKKKGTKHSEETRKKMSESHKGINTWSRGRTFKFSPEVLARLRAKRAEIAAQKAAEGGCD